MTPCKSSHCAFFPRFAAARVIGRSIDGVLLFDKLMCELCAQGWETIALRRSSIWLRVYRSV